MAVLSENNVIRYRASRLRFFLYALIALPPASIMAFSIYVVAASDYDGEIILALLDAIIYCGFATIMLAKLFFPPEITISTSNIRLVDRSWFIAGNYGWNEIDGPQKGATVSGVPYLAMTVKASGRKILMSPANFGATYEEIAAIITGARSGWIFDPALWRKKHLPIRQPVRLKTLAIPACRLVVFSFGLLYSTQAN